MQQVSLSRRILWLLLLLSSWGALQAAIPDQRDQLLQFTAAGHVLGFQHDGYYVAGGNHMLHVAFIGATGATPRAAGASNGDSVEQLLNRVSYDNLWPGVNLRYDATADGIAQSTWVIAPGAHAEAIRLRYNTPLEILPDGSLKIAYRTGWMHESAPIAWQEISGRRRPVEVAFRLIDPTLVWNTMMGSGFDSGWGVAVDHSGNIYVAGRSDATWGSPLNPHAGDSDVFVAKLNSSGQLQWNTFMGSASGNDESNAIATGGRDNLYVVGSNSVECTEDYAFAARLRDKDCTYYFINSEEGMVIPVCL